VPNSYKRKTCYNNPWRNPNFLREQQQTEPQLHRKDFNYGRGVGTEGRSRGDEIGAYVDS
jgi:hypothetical protein